MRKFAIFLAAVAGIAVAVVALREGESTGPGTTTQNAGGGESGAQTVQPKSAAPRVDSGGAEAPEAAAGTAERPESVFRPKAAPEPGSGHAMALLIGWEEGDPRAEYASDWKRQLDAEVGELQEELNNGGDPPQIWVRHNRLVDRHRERLLAQVGEENLPAILRVVKLFKYGEQGEEIRIEE